MVDCFLAFQDTNESPKKKQKPVVDILESAHEAQSASENAHNSIEDDEAKNNP